MQAYDGMIVGEHSRDTDLDVRMRSLLLLLLSTMTFFISEINMLRICDRLTLYETRHLQIYDLLEMMRTLSCHHLAELVYFTNS